MTFNFKLIHDIIYLEISTMSTRLASSSWPEGHWELELWLARSHYCFAGVKLCLKCSFGKKVHYYLWWVGGCRVVAWNDEVRAWPTDQSVNLVAIAKHWGFISSWLLCNSARCVRLYCLALSSLWQSLWAGETQIGCSAVLYHPACCCHSHNWFVLPICCISKVRTDLVTLEPC